MKNVLNVKNLKLVTLWGTGYSLGAHCNNGSLLSLGGNPLTEPEIKYLIEHGRINTLKLAQKICKD
jgi:hypothetical protein